MLGSVANEVLARGHEPLVLVGPLFDEERQGSGIFAAVDETPGSAPVLLAARHWAEMLGEALTVLTVADRVLLDDEALFAVLHLLDTRRPIAKLRVDVVVPQVERLEDMTVGIDDVVGATHQRVLRE